MVKTIIEEATAVSLLNTDLTLVWQSSQSPHTRSATFSQVLTSMASLPATFGSVTVTAGALNPGPSTAQFNTLSSAVTSTSSSITTEQTQLADLENRVSVLESGGTQTGITITGIPDQTTVSTFAVSGSLINYGSAPTLETRDNSGAFAALPGSPTVTKTSYTFTHAAVGTPTGAMTVTVRDKNATTVTATSNSFAVVNTAAGAPDPPTGLAFAANSGSSITVTFTPATTGAAIDSGGFQLQYKPTASTNWVDGPFIPFVTSNVGRIVDPAGSVWQITNSVITQTTAGGTVTDGVTSSVTQLLLVRNIFWHLTANPANPGWYWNLYTTFPGSWTGNIATSPLLSPGVRVPESGLGLAVNSAYNIRVAAANSVGLGLYSTPITASTATTNTFTTG